MGSRLPIHTTMAIWRRRPRGIRLLATALLGVALCLTLACYDEDAFVSMALSPDGRWLAATTAHHELGILDLTSPTTPFTVYSNYAADRFAWSPDSARLAYVENYPNHACALWLLDPKTGRMDEPLLADPAWKADPVWLSSEQLAYLSDRGGEDVNVWSYDLATRHTEPIVDRAADVTALWGAPGSGSVVFECAESGTNELWWWWRGGTQPVQLTKDRIALLGESPVAISRDGHAIVYVAGAAQPARLVWLDLSTQQVLETLALDQAVTSLAILSDGRVAAAEDRALAIWRPRAPWYRRTVVKSSFDGGLPFAGVVAKPQGGVVVGLNHNILLVADDPMDLKSGRLHARRREDMINLAQSYADAGQRGNAQAILDDLWASSLKGSAPRVYIAAAEAKLSRLSRRWRPADDWLTRAAESVRPGSREAEAVWLERLAVNALDMQNLPRARDVLKQLPEGPAGAPLARWLRALLATKDDPLRREWLAIGRGVRAAQYHPAAIKVREALSREAWTTTSLQGLNLILNGDLEPMNAPDSGNPGGGRGLAALLNEPAFQLAMLQASRTPRETPDGPDPRDVRAQLLTQWVRQGDLGSARDIVREDLATSPTARIDYCGILRQYLIVEEAEHWLQRAVTDVLLEKSIAQTLEMRFTQPDCRVALGLAQVKAALLDGDVRRAQERLDAVRGLEAKAGAAALPGVESDPTLDRAADHYLTLLFQAKIRERAGDWDAALAAYRQALDLIAGKPDNWDIAAFEITAAIGLIESGRHNPDALREFQGVLRGMGDPLLNPSRDPVTIHYGQSNLATLQSRSAQDVWLQPYLIYSQAMCCSRLNDSWRALIFLRRAREMKPPASLLPRILLEEAALRDAVGEHDLAARLYARLAEASGAAPMKAQAIQMRIQAEQHAGYGTAPPARLEELLRGEQLGGPWSDWLRLQVGAQPTGGEIKSPGDGEAAKNK